MIIKRGTILKVIHSRKGVFFGMARRDFDLADEWYDIILAQVKEVVGLNTTWESGDEVPCRGEFCKLEIIKKPE